MKRIFRLGQTYYGRYHSWTKFRIKEIYRHEPFKDGTKGLTVSYDETFMRHSDDFLCCLVPDTVHKRCGIGWAEMYMRSKKVSRRNTIFCQLSTAEFAKLMRKGNYLLKPTFQPMEV